MKKRCLLFSLILILSVITISATSVDEEFKKLANYASEYETGNINYVQLLMYTSAIKENLNQILGATGQQMGGIVKEEQIRSILSEPTEETKWVYSEGENKEIKLDHDIPIWKKIVFDGRKIQIKLNAWPSIFSKGKFNNDGQEGATNDLAESFDGKLVYRLNFETQFKKPAEQLDIQGKINSIKSIAETFNLDPSSANAEILAKESVSAERIFESYFKQSGGKCEDLMSSIFGSENKRTAQNMFVKEVNFCEGDNYEVLVRLEMCDDCEGGNWINMNFNVMGRGPGFKMPDMQKESSSPKSFEAMSAEEIESEIKTIIDEAKQACDNQDISAVVKTQSKLGALNEAWNQKSNNVWQEVDKIYKSQTESMTQEERMKFDQNYGWIKQEQEKRKKVNELIKSNYEVRKQFYINLFSNYDSKDFYFTQIEYQQRLVEEFKVNGKETCNNNLDDNQDGAIDCADQQCGGKICGKGKSTSQTGNETLEEVNYYCIESTCKAREEAVKIVINVSNVSMCPEVPTVVCSEGSKAFFSKYDTENNCPLEASCLNATDSCKINEDCQQPACGIAECIEGACKVTTLAECKELECVDGDKKICESDGIIAEICNNGFWEKTGDCEVMPIVKEEPTTGNECLTVNDCGEKGVCNNGVCEILPEVIIVEPDVIEEGDVDEGSTGGEVDDAKTTPNEPVQQEEKNEEPSEPSSDVTGGIIFRFMNTLISKIKIMGAMITGFEVDTSSESSSEPQNQEQNPSNNVIINNGPNDKQNNGENNVIINYPPQQNGQPNEYQGDNPDEQDNNRNDEQRQQDEERMQKENKARCEDNCKRPCIEQCIRDACGEKFDCNVDESQKTCEGTCSPKDSCVEKCIKGEDMQGEFENDKENKQEKGVFQAGGTCRTEKGVTQGFIWFGGWGEPFSQIQPLKDKYYTGGQGDWCKYDFENLQKQRTEFEAGFNQEFVTWFFEKYLANSAENWEQSVSGIFELYWKDVDNSREMAYRMQCLEMTELPKINLINIEYNTEYGHIKFWEEIKTVKLEGMDKEVQVISPYMQAWVFPSKEFITYQMKKAMKNHEFPGSPEEKMNRKNEEGLTAGEREMLKQDEKFMGVIKTISEKYNGNLDAVVQFKDYTTDEIVFNLYVQVNENDILKIEPMLPEEVPSEDIKIEMDFNIIYEMIYNSQKDMMGERIESPPWDKQMRPVQKIKEITSGIKSYFKIRSLLNSAKITPEESRKDVNTLIKKFMSMMTQGDNSKQDSGSSGPNAETDDNTQEGDSSSNDIFESKDPITGKVIS